MNPLRHLNVLNLLKVTLFVTALSLVTVHADEAGLCPVTGNAFPDASQSTAALFVSYSPLVSDQTVTVTYDAIKRYSPFTKLYLIMTQADYQRYLRVRDYCAPSAAASMPAELQYLCQIDRVLNDRAQVRVIGLDHPVTEIYAQDYFQFFLHNGRPALFPIVHPLESGFGSSNSYSTPQITADALAQQIRLVKPYVTTQGHRGAPNTMGGNIESLPGNIVVMGDMFFGEKRKTDEQLRRSSAREPKFKAEIDELHATEATHVAQEKLVHQLGFQLLTLDTHFTPVGHADEVFSVIKTNAPCGFSILIPAPNLALEMLSQIKSVEQPRCIRAAANREATFGRNRQAILDHINDGCIGFRGDTPQSLLGNAKFTTLNHDFDRIIRANRERITQALSLVCAAPDFIELPYLVGHIAQSFMTESVVPNPVNAMVITPPRGLSVYINNPTFVRSFDNSIRQKLSEKGVTLQAVWDPVYFEGEGGLHCASNTIQTCE